jgi:hypothetical protein
MSTRTKLGSTVVLSWYVNLLLPYQTVIWQTLLKNEIAKSDILRTKTVLGPFLRYLYVVENLFLAERFQH